jgi:hypothetical protein
MKQCIEIFGLDNKIKNIQIIADDICLFCQSLHHIYDSFFLAICMALPMLVNIGVGG